MSWHKIVLSSDDIREVKMQEIQNKYSKLLIQSKDAALFSIILQEKGVELYFSPEASKYAINIIQQYSAIPCEKPNKLDASLLVGHHGAQDWLL